MARSLFPLRCVLFRVSDACLSALSASVYYHRAADEGLPLSGAWWRHQSPFPCWSTALFCLRVPVSFGTGYTPRLPASKKRFRVSKILTCSDTKLTRKQFMALFSPIFTPDHHHNINSRNLSRYVTILMSEIKDLELPDFVRCIMGKGPPLWSSGHSSWLLTQRSRVRFLGLPDFLSSNGSRTGSTQPREDKWRATWKKSSGSGLENWD
jgi:hypothetical protein